RRVVDEEDVVFALDRGAVDAKAQDSVEQYEHREDLQEQKDVLPQPLEKAVDVQVFDALAPQECTRHLERPALQPQEIKQKDGKRHEQQDQCKRAVDGELVAKMEVLAKPFVDRPVGAEKVQDDEDQARER